MSVSQLEIGTTASAIVCLGLLCYWSYSCSRQLWLTWAHWLTETSDMVWIPPGEKHWHGTTPTTSITHTAIQEQLNCKTPDWMEKVID